MASATRRTTTSEALIVFERSSSRSHCATRLAVTTMRVVRVSRALGTPPVCATRTRFWTVYEHLMFGRGARGSCAVRRTSPMIPRVFPAPGGSV